MWIVLNDVRQVRRVGVRRGGPGCYLDGSELLLTEIEKSVVCCRAVGEFRQIVEAATLSSKSILWFQSWGINGVNFI